MRPPCATSLAYGFDDTLDAHDVRSRRRCRCNFRSGQTSLGDGDGGGVVGIVVVVVWWQLCVNCSHENLSRSNTSGSWWWESTVNRWPEFDTMPCCRMVRRPTNRCY